MANEKFKINGVVSEVVPIVGGTGDVLRKTVSGVEWGALVKATQTQDGLLGKEDFNKLQGIETGAEKNNVTSTDITNWNNKVDVVSGKQLSTNDYTTTEKNKLAGIEIGAQKNTITSVQGRTGAVTVSKSDVGLGNVDNVKQASKVEHDQLSSDFSAHQEDDVPHQYGSRFEWRYNSVTDSLDLVVI